MTSVESGVSQAATHVVEAARRKPAMERVIDSLATGLGTTVGWLAESGVLFVVFGVIWVAVAIGLVWSQGTVEQAWQAIRSLPFAIQLVVWVLFLPVMVGLWVWETSWPLVVRVVLVIGVAGWNLLIFLPRTLQAKA